MVQNTSLLQPAEVFEYPERFVRQRGADGLAFEDDGAGEDIDTAFEEEHDRRLVATLADDAEATVECDPFGLVLGRVAGSMFGVPNLPACVIEAGGDSQDDFQTAISRLGAENAVLVIDDIRRFGRVD